MKNFTKVLTLLFLFFCLGLAACGEKPNPSPNEPEKEDPNPDIPIKEGLKDKYDCISIEKAIELAKEAGDVGTTEKYYIYGTIKKISNPVYGEMTITDGVNELYIYGTTNESGTLYGEITEDKPIANDEVVIYGNLKTYNGEAEMGRSVIKDFKHVETSVDISSYEEKTVAEAREASEGKLVKLTGVVSQITYANGMIPDGFILVDNTSSIYVYGVDTAQLVSVGNTVTIAGEKTYYVLEKEQDNAKKYGYKGCCQIDKAILVENDKKVSEFDKSWIEEVSIKNIMETSVTENITTKLYKVTSLVKKELGSGFVNYYFNDLDGVTGSYVYTKCNGKDYSWLDEFDGKFCTIYLTAINAKSTASGCNFRFVPVLVKNDGYKFDLKDTPKFVYDYYIASQFKTEYTGDPILEVITSVSNELLGFKNASISYSSSDKEVVDFTKENDKLIMHTKKSGSSFISVSVSYGDYSYTEKLTIEVKNLDDIKALSIKDAISANDDEVVTVKGIVMSSLVNQTGFYLNDETGIIAVTCSSDVLAEIELGQMIIVKGTKIHKKKEASGAYAGQIVISEATVVANLYGKHEYSKASFDSTKTLKDLYELDHTKDYSTTVYIVKAMVDFFDGGRYTIANIKSSDGKTTLSLYCSSGEQYSWLKEFVGKEVELEIAMCNWNGKDHYKGCVVSATLDGKTIVNDLNFR